MCCSMTWDAQAEQDLSGCSPQKPLSSLSINQAETVAEKGSWQFEDLLNKHNVKDKKAALHGFII